MSVSGISSSNLFDYSNQNVQDSGQKIRQEFQQLGQDLQSGNLSAAQSDFATLQQLAPQNSSTASTTSSSPLVQAFNQLAQDLQSGNLSGAQQDFSNIQQAFQSQASHAGQSQGHHHHHHGGGAGGSSALSQLFDQLGQALQSGNLSAAQEAYNSILQDFQAGQSSGQSSSQQSTQSGTSTVSVSA